MRKGNGKEVGVRSGSGAGDPMTEEGQWREVQAVLGAEAAVAWVTWERVWGLLWFVQGLGFLSVPGEG